jgi:Ca2+/Na+ antiporter
MTVLYFTQKRQSINRLTGVTIIAILTIIGGILLCFGGISLLALGAFLLQFLSIPIYTIISEQQQQQLQPEIQNQAELEALTQFLAGIGIVIGAIILAVGIGYLVVSYCLLKGKGMGMDCNNHIDYHSNSNTNYFYDIE